LAKNILRLCRVRIFPTFVENGDTMIGNDPFAMQEFGELAKSLAEN